MAQIAVIRCAERVIAKPDGQFGKLLVRTKQLLGEPTPQQMMAAEAKRIEVAIPEQSLRVILDEHGRDLTTQAFATKLNTWHQASHNITIIIGGPDGLDQDLKSSSDASIRLSSMTMPHPMVRIVLIEQLYRAWSILNNHPYHRA